MRRRILLKKTVTMARTGDADSFQSFYILTVEETYGKAYALVKERGKAEDLVTDVYASLYHKIHTLPVEEEDLIYRIEEEIYHVAEKALGLEIQKKEEHSENYEVLPEERAATLWMRIEEKTGLNREDDEDVASWKIYLRSGIHIIGAAGALILTAGVLFMGWKHLVLPFRQSVESVAEVPESEAEKTVSPIIIEEEKETPGWKEGPELKLYYITKEGELADGTEAIGKQLLKFSSDGALTLIERNLEVAENGNLSFDEEIRYEVREGNVYRRNEDGTEVCAVRNGHVIQADIRCGYLWYICEYQLPNTEQVKTTIYRALPNGEEQTEVYSTNAILETDSFQVTSRWYYYLSDGKLFRKSLENGKTEFLEEDVVHYFAWEDRAYYMKDRVLESVSEGRTYSGLEAGYQIENTGSSFILRNGTGEIVLEGGSGSVKVGDRIYQIKGGSIAGVSPAERKDGNVVYYLEASGSERKLYWKDAAGTRGLLPQEGMVIDSFCIAGDWLYYCSRTAQYGGECQSQIYRLNLRTNQTEPVGNVFRGVMRNLYYFDNVQTIYGEYISSLADENNIHGSIAKVSVDQMGVINDKTVRPVSEGSDMLELVMATENKLYCLYHECTYDTKTGNAVWKTTKPLEITLY